MAGLTESVEEDAALEWFQALGLGGINLELYMCKLFAAVLLAAFSTSASAAASSERPILKMTNVNGSTTVANFIEICDGNPMLERSPVAQQNAAMTVTYCLGYLAGLSDGYIAGIALHQGRAGDEQSPDFCFEKMSNEDAMAALRIGLKRKIVEPTLGIRLAFNAVLFELFPCPSRNPSGS